MDSDKKIYEEIKRELKIRKRSQNNKNYNSEESVDAFQGNFNIISENLEMMENSWSIQEEHPIISHRKFIGKFIVFAKKIERKLLRWYMNPMKEKQTLYNASNVRAVNSINNILENYSGTVGELLIKYTEIEKKLRKEENSVCLSDKSQNNNDEFRAYVDIVRKTGDIQAYKKSIEIFLENVEKELEVKKIAIICKNYKKDEKIEAIKKEAFTLFKLLKEKSGFSVSMISIEEEIENDNKKNEVIYIKRENLKSLLDKMNFDVVHIFESNPHILFEQELGLLGQNVVFQITGQEPLLGFDNWAIDEMIHLSDNNRLNFITESDYSREKFKENNIRNVYKLSPLLEELKVDFKKNEKFTIGFASSPMKESETESRGVFLLNEIVSELSDISFKIAWRNKEIEVPKKLLNADNVKIEYGKLNMEDFYADVDAIIIPYTSYENNHACSLSALEALTLNLPVLATKKSGVSEIIKNIDRNCVFEANKEECIKTLKYVKENTEIIKKKIENHYDVAKNDTIIKKYIEIYETYITEKIPLLFEWNNMLLENNKFLVKGNENIKKYYESKDIVINYIADRFLDYPMNIVNEIEKNAVKKVVEKKFEKDGNLDILDIAAGTGRIIEGLLDFGKCEVMDNSQEMLNIMSDRFDGKVTLTKGDFFTFELEKNYDVITTFRYIRHFDYKERKLIFEKIYKNLIKGGYLIFDVPNLRAEIILRNKIGWGNFNIYDAFWTEKSIKLELESYGFKLIKLLPVDGYLFEQVREEDSELSISWIAIVQK